MSLFKIDCCYKHKCQHLVFNEADRYQWNDAGENHSPCHHDDGSWMGDIFALLCGQCCFLHDSSLGGRY